MFELGTTDHWWNMAKKYPSLSNHTNTLKPLGYAHVASLIEKYNSKKVLEVGHGAGSHLFDLFEEDMEFWGLDDVVEGSKVLENDLEWMREEYPSVKFVRGLLGNNIKELPNNYFDMVCSVSVIEHIPINVLNNSFEETFRILKPGGIVCHSYDIHYGQNTKPVFDAFEKAGFNWLKSKDTMNVFWEEWLGEFDKNRIIDLFKKIILENPIYVAEVYMWQTERSIRKPQINWLSVLTGAKKPGG